MARWLTSCYHPARPMRRRNGPWKLSSKPLPSRSHPSASRQPCSKPGSVSSGALDDVTTYTPPDDPYTAILRGGGPRAGMITPAQVAAEVADAAEKPQLPLRIPIGDAARALLAARQDRKSVV